MMVAPALCTECSEQFSRMARLFQVFKAFQGSHTAPGRTRRFLSSLDVSGCNWTSLDVTGHHWMSLDVTGGVWISGRYVWTVPEHLVLGICWLASSVGTGSA